MSFLIPKASETLNKLPIFGALVTLSQTNMIGNVFDWKLVL